MSRTRARSIGAGYVFHGSLALIRTAHPDPMASDGSFYGQDISGTISGRVSGTYMEGKIDGAACLYSFTADQM